MRLLALAISLLLIGGCSRVVYTTQEVLIPIACIDSMPPKVKLGKDNIDNIVRLQRAYLDLRLILSKCIRRKNEKD